MVHYLEIVGSTHLKLELAIFPTENPKGILQIIHGALEYKERYFDFARYLQNKGFIVVLSDNQGHGNSESKNQVAGYMEDYREIVEDQYLVTQKIKGLYPRLPLYLFGHSFGSILARLYLQEHDDEIKKLVLTGTVNYLPAGEIGLRLKPFFQRIIGKKNHSHLVSFLTNNIEAKNNDWLSNNPENNQRAKKDGKMLGSYPVQSNITIWESNHQLKAYEDYQCKNPNLKILSLVGAEDTKITGGSKGINDTVETLQKIGYHDIQSILMADMKHEVLNEVNRELVYEKIYQFLES